MYTQCSIQAVGELCQSDREARYLKVKSEDKIWLDGVRSMMYDSGLTEITRYKKMEIEFITQCGRARVSRRVTCSVFTARLSVLPRCVCASRPSLPELKRVPYGDKPIGGRVCLGTGINPVSRQNKSIEGENDKLLKKSPRKCKRIDNNQYLQQKLNSKLQQQPGVT